MAKDLENRKLLVKVSKLGTRVVGTLGFLPVTVAGAQNIRPTLEITGDGKFCARIELEWNATIHEVRDIFEDATQGM